MEQHLTKVLKDKELTRQNKGGTFQKEGSLKNILKKSVAWHIWETQYQVVRTQETQSDKRSLEK